MITNLRCMYDQTLKPGRPLDYNLFSEAGTLTGTLTEVYTYIHVYHIMLSSQLLTMNRTFLEGF